MYLWHILGNSAKMTSYFSTLNQSNKRDLYINYQPGVHEELVRCRALYVQDPGSPFTNGFLHAPMKSKLHQIMNIKHANGNPAVTRTSPCITNYDKKERLKGNQTNRKKKHMWIRVKPLAPLWNFNESQYGFISVVCCVDYNTNHIL